MGRTIAAPNFPGGGATGFANAAAKTRADFGLPAQPAANGVEPVTYSIEALDYQVRDVTPTSVQVLFLNDLSFKSMLQPSSNRTGHVVSRLDMTFAAGDWKIADGESSLSSADEQRLTVDPGDPTAVAAAGWRALNV